MEVKPGYKQTEVGVIPEDWEVKQLSDFSDLQVGFAFKSTWFGKNSGIRLLRGENVGYGRADWSETRTLATKNIDAYQSYLLESGNIVIGMDRTFTKSGTKITILRKDDCPCLLVQRVGKFIPRECDKNFLWFILTSERVQSILRLEQKGMDIPHLSRTEILHPLAPLPPLPEQRAIATALSDVDALIDALNQLIAKKRDLKQAAMQELLTGKKRLPGFSGEWEKKKLGEIATIYQPITISQSDLKDDGYLVYGANGIIGKYDKYNHETWQITITCRGSTCGTVNKTIEKSWITGNAMVINCDNSESLHKLFLYYLLLSQDFTVCITGSGQPQIVRLPLATWSLKIPNNVDEQRAITAVLSDIDAEIAVLEQRLEKTRALKTGMMQELLTGRIRLV